MGSRMSNSKMWRLRSRGGYGASSSLIEREIPKLRMSKRPKSNIFGSFCGGGNTVLSASHRGGWTRVPVKREVGHVQRRKISAYGASSSSPEDSSEARIFIFPLSHSAPRLLSPTDCWDVH